jgi:linoleoyl-CoA desaturase
MPSSRYGEIAPKVRDVCRRYGLPYNTGPFSKQWGSVQRTILRLAFPGGKPRPKPGPYRGTDTEAAPAASSNGASSAASHNGDRGSEQPAATENVAAQGPGGG